jgi:hypothetical protein
MGGGEGIDGGELAAARAAVAPGVECRAFWVQQRADGAAKTAAAKSGEEPAAEEEEERKAGEAEVSA